MFDAIKKHATLKSVLGIVSMLLIFAAIVLYIGLRVFSDELMGQYSGEAFQTAEKAAEAVDADRMDAYVASGGEGEEYEAVWSQLDYLCNATGSTFVYVIIPDRSDYAHITFIFSTINEKSDYTKYDFGYVRETTNDDYRQKYAALYDLVSDQELVIRDRGYIETDPHITAMIGLKGSDGQVKAILCVQRQMDVLAQARQSYMTSVLIAVVVLSIVVIVLQVLFLNKTLLKPLMLISAEADRFATENTPAETKLADRISNIDEIGQLAADIDIMEERVRDYVDNLMEATVEKERFSTELDLANNIQASMLPSIFPAFPERGEFELYASMNPAKEVGGDFYDFFLLDEDRLAIVMADVSGKGVPAALFMMASKIMINDRALVGGTPSEILMSVNDAICAHNDAEMFVTVWLGILELSSGKLVAVNAGHEYPAFKKTGGSFELVRNKHGLVVGFMEGVPYKDVEFTLEPGDKLFLYTDGVSEAQNSEDELFGYDRMLAALNVDPDADEERIIANVRQAIADFVGDAEQFDDITMLCLEYKGPVTD